MLEAAAVRALAALAQPHRLRIHRALVVAGHAGLTPGALAQSLHMAPATLSFHLKGLTGAALVTQERRGRHLIYRAAFESMNALITYLTENCCAGAPCAVDATSGCEAPAS